MHAEKQPIAPMGWWQGEVSPHKGPEAIRQAICRVSQPVYILQKNGEMAVADNGPVVLGNTLDASESGWPLIGHAAPLHPEMLGHPAFKKMLNLRYAYVAGAMANGITSVEMVVAACRAGMTGFFGAAGLAPAQVAHAVDQLKQQAEGYSFGCNLIHSPYEPQLEKAIVDLYLQKQVRLISASAYLGLTAPIVYYRIKGIYRQEDGRIVCPNRIIAKVSRVEVAEKFLSPPPRKIVDQLVAKGLINDSEARLSQEVPMADALSAEADSGGHTDNRPALTLLPTMISLRNRVTSRYGYPQTICIGLGGGIATPESAAAAFAAGADYLLTGTVNQACVESGTSDRVRQMLCEAAQADVTMAPAADMFEMGVKVQVLKRGTMFAIRAGKLYEHYRAYENWAQVPQSIRTTLERDYFRCSFDQEWEQTRKFFEVRDPAQIEKARKDPRHQMALVFRSYLGRSSGWANSGEPSRQLDYQIWCGPAMGAFNEWVRGSCLEPPANRKTVDVAMNLLFGAAVLARANVLRQQGVPLPAEACTHRPMPLSEIQSLLE